MPNIKTWHKRQRTELSKKNVRHTIMQKNICKHILPIISSLPAHITNPYSPSHHPPQTIDIHHSNEGKHRRHSDLD